MKKFIACIFRLGIKIVIVLAIINFSFSIINNQPIKSYKTIFVINEFPQKVDNNISFIIFAIEKVKPEFKKLRKEFNKVKKAS